MKDKLPIYYKCNMTKGQHLLAYVIFAVLLSAVFFIFYHVIWISVFIGFAAAIPVERMYAKSTISKRQKSLRLQFKDFLSSMSVAARAGNVEIKAIKSALEDLKLTYTNESDIVREVEYIVLQYEKGGVELKVLFEDLADRSNLEDIKNFSTIFRAIDGKNDRFGDVVVQTEEIISEKIEIEMEIETVITSAKTEAITMLFMPVPASHISLSFGAASRNALSTITLLRHATSASFTLSRASSAVELG